MARTGCATAAALCTLVLLALATPAPAAAVDCTAAFAGLADCLDYISPGSKANRPSKTCCREVKTAVSSAVNVDCLCAALAAMQSPLPVNMARVLALPAACGEYPTVFANCRGEHRPHPSPSSSIHGDDPFYFFEHPPELAAPSVTKVVSGDAHSPIQAPSGSPSPIQAPSGSPSPIQGKGASAGAIGGGVAAGVIALVLGVLVFLFYRRRRLRRLRQETPLPSSEDPTRLASTISVPEVTPSITQADGASPVDGITIDRSVEFSYEELFNATDGFNVIHKIGQGGFGAVYYAELRGKKAAIKKMDMQATQEFHAELNVLAHVHHLNLVGLIGYCTENSLFLVYEFIENGNLSQHLCGTNYDPLSWAERVQIALDSARGLEYLHEHTVPVYIHRDIKSANILIDKNNRAKVADFGLAKLTEVGGATLQTRVVGTYGYMAPEYARYGEVSPKVDVYAFGVVLYELISAKDAIVRSTDSSTDLKGLVYLFEDALNTPDPKEFLRKLIDPKLGDDYSIDAILKMTRLAYACTQEDRKLRPTMRSVVVALMALSSTTEFRDIDALYENLGLINLMSGR